MGFKDDPHREILRQAGWSSRGYLPHFDGRAIPQFITLHLADAVPATVIKRWQSELKALGDEQKKTLLRRRIEKYLDQGYGSASLGKSDVATMVQEALLNFDGQRYKLHAWVVMPNHVHILFTRAEKLKLWKLMKDFKGYTAHEANKMLGREGQFWMEDYFDRYMRDGKHYRKTVAYIENNPVKARLCTKPEDWPFSSAYMRKK